LYKLGKICAIYGEDLSIENSKLCNNKRESSQRAEYVLFASHCSSGWQRDILVRDAEGVGRTREGGKGEGGERERERERARETGVV